MPTSSPISKLTVPFLQPPAGLERIRTRLVLLGFWCTLGLMETAKELTAARLLQIDRDLSEALIINFPWWFFWVFGTLIAVSLASRWTLTGPRIAAAAAVHIGAALLIAFVHLTLVGLLIWFAVARGGNTAGADPFIQVRFWVEGYLVLDFFVYWMVLGAYQALIYHQRYVQGTLREAEARTQAMRYEAAAMSAHLKALQMELNPHFLFNSLNAVSGLVDEGRTTQATAVIARLAQLLRLTLNRGHDRELRLDSELEYIELYLAMEQVRFGPRLVVDVIAGQEVADARVPPMILQPLVENAIRHGVSHVKGPARVTIHAHRDGSLLHVKVSDTGPGSDVSDNQFGTGLSNVRDRLHALYGPRAALTVHSDCAGAGFVASIRLPFSILPPHAPPIRTT